MLTSNTLWKARVSLQMFWDCTSDHQTFRSLLANDILENPFLPFKRWTIIPTKRKSLPSKDLLRSPLPLIENGGKPGKLQLRFFSLPNLFYCQVTRAVVFSRSSSTEIRTIEERQIENKADYRGEKDRTTYRRQTRRQNLFRCNRQDLGLFKQPIRFQET